MKEKPKLVKKEILDLLCKQLKNGQPHHAYLFTGESHWEKKATAEHFAAHLISFSSTDEKKNTEQIFASTLSRLEKNTHPDLKKISPKGKFLQIEDFRPLSKILSFPPLEGKYRVVLIENMEKSNTSSANSILKILEEPPPYVIFLLLTRAASLLLPTIVSRCHLLQFPSLTAKKIIPYLKKEFPAEIENTIRKASLWGESSYETAHNFLTNLELRESIEKSSRMLLSLWKSFPSIPSAHIENIEIPRTKEEIEALLHSWTLLVRDLSFLSIEETAPVFHTEHKEDLFQIIKNLKEKGIKEEIGEKIQYINKSKQYLEANGNPKLVLASLLCKMQFCI